MTALTLLPGVWEPQCPAAGIAWLPPCGWGLPRLWSAGAALGLMLLLILSAQLLNKRFDFITGTDMVLPTVFFLLLASNPAVGATFGSPLLLALAGMAMLALAMDCYRSSNGTQQIFVAATIASVGIMVDTAFIIPALWCPPAWAAMKCFRFKELMAYGLGLVAPWWCGIGTGLIPLESLDVAPLSRWLTMSMPSPEEAVQIGTTCWWAFLAVIIGLNTAVKLYAGNSKVRALNSVITLLGLASLAGMVFDIESMTAFLGMFYFTVSVQVAQIFALWNVPRARTWLWIIMLVITVQFPLILLI